MTYQPSEADEYSAQINALMGRLHKDSERRGWKFYVQPPAEVLPEFLKGHQPDAISIGPDGGVVIEIKVRQNGAQSENLAKISDLVEAQKGWEFRLFYVSSPVDGRLNLPTPTAEELASGLSEARKLLESGHERAALLIAWSLLESIARLVTPMEEKSKTQPLSPMQTVQALAELGYVEEVDAQRLRRLTRLRNAVAHGGLGIPVPIEVVTQLIDDLEKIMHTIETNA